MNIILQIVKEFGRSLSKPCYFAITVNNPPFTSLIIEGIGKGPCDRPAVSVAHYSEQNGDLMRDPEMCFEVDGDSLVPYYYRNDYLGIEEISRCASPVRVNSTRFKGQVGFAKQWFKNIESQGFLERAKL